MNIKKLASAFAILLIASVACVKERTVYYSDVEQRSLNAWIEKYHEELLSNYQEDGGYYVEILEEGNGEGIVTGKDVWMWFDITVRDLQGNIQETRSADVALQLATYTSYAHY
ncbi:MAG: hypothetical protein J6V05_03315, partial [Alistipes sp.]|nr:hypothetical protein [Alistipes sp.]